MEQTNQSNEKFEKQRLRNLHGWKIQNKMAVMFNNFSNYNKHVWIKLINCNTGALRLDFNNLHYIIEIYVTGWKWRGWNVIQENTDQKKIAITL